MSLEGVVNPAFEEDDECPSVEMSCRGDSAISAGAATAAATAVAGRKLIDANDAEANALRGYCANHFITSQYTALNFLPKFMFETFSKVANVFFLAIGIMQAIPSISTTNGVPLQLIPLTMVVLFDGVITAMEDVKRHKADAAENERRTLRWDCDAGEFVEVQWQELQVGQIVKVKNREPCPADILLLATSQKDEGGQPTGTCFVETKSLDGETNLKLREALEPAIERVWEPEDCGRIRFRVQCELPNPDIENFSGNFELVEGGAEQGAGAGGGAAVTPITPDNLVLRGCVLRSSDWVYGFVINTGADCKIAQSSDESGGEEKKRSTLEAAMNAQVVVICFILLAMCALAVGLSWADELQLKNAWYLGTPEGSRQSVCHANPDECTDATFFLVGDGVRDAADVVTLFFYYFALMSSLIPITLYVSIDFVKLWQAKFMEWDLRMYHAETDTPALVRNMKLTEQLGAIQYIFSDKTGTLTQNVMEFRKCSINGTSYGTGTTEIGRAAARRTAGKGAPKRAPPAAIQEEEEEEGGGEVGEEGASVEVVSQPFVNFSDDRLWAAIDGNDGDQHRRACADFFQHLALCHTVVPEPLESGEVVLSASSPDESALVAGASFFGWDFVGRTQGAVQLCVGSSARDKAKAAKVGEGGGAGAAAGRDSNWEVLEVLEFNSTRKRMSVIVRQKGGAGGLKLLCKGADNVIMERLANSARNDKVLDMTQAHCETYAEEGLRTLFVAQADIAPAKFAAWQKRFQSAQADPAELAKRVALEPNRIDDVMDEIESGLQLLGATAIEDKLQDGVPPAIASLAKAGVKLWVLTGDKTETAINIAFACELLHNDMELIRADSSTCPDEDATAGFLASAADAAEMGDAALGSQSLARDGRGKAATPGSSSARSEEDDRSSLVDSSSGGSSGGGSGGTKRRRRTSLMAHTITATACQDRALVIDGPVLSHALRSEEAKAELLRLAVRCKAVVACRVSPKQKAEMVKLVQDNVPDVTSLAIGDGANDVPMIKAASVGVGISGQEGMQAVNNSDFAIAQFRFLAPLMLLHGRWNYGRLAKLVLYTFYKNFVYNIAMFRCGDTTRRACPVPARLVGFCSHTPPLPPHLPPPRPRPAPAPSPRSYANYSAASGTMFYNIWYQLGFNTVYTAWPVVLYAFLDQDVAAEDALRYPVLYDRYLNGQVFSVRKFWVWIAHAVFESAIVIWVPVFFLAPMNYAGTALSMEQIGTASWHCMILVVSIKLFVHQHQWTRVQMVAWWLSLALWFLTAVLLGMNLAVEVELGWIGVIPKLFFMPGFWVIQPLIVVMALSKDVVAKGYVRATRPEFYHIVNEAAAAGTPDKRKLLEKANPHSYRQSDLGLRRQSARPGSRRPTSQPVAGSVSVPVALPERNMGFAFSEDESASVRRMDFFRRGHERALKARSRVRIALTEAASHVRNASRNATGKVPAIHRHRTDGL